MGFIVLPDQPGGPSAFFSDVSIPANVAKVGLHTVNSIVGDGVVVWRCYLIWTREWRMCIIPILLVIASATCGFAQTVFFARGTDLHSAFSPELKIWNGALFSLSLVTNVIVTCLIAVRAWYMLNLSGGTSSFRYWRVLVMVIESGMIYSVALICEISLYFLNLNAFYIVYDPIGQLTGITPTLILVLAGLEMTTNDVHSRMTKRTLTKPHFRPGVSDTDTSEPTQTVPLDRVDLRMASSNSTFRGKYTNLRPDENVDADLNLNVKPPAAPLDGV
ncbi:predicted protein [Sparassis crispa]|uniref:Uncharacterized protein n=1 Tax=Sparassis crispa TaxID=139825 RepID=A0A401GSB4_9APHY|nr:predicted protein [Sparassis crispa]GBE85106.1 predicted protein [Sparassis crispa]